MEAPRTIRFSGKMMDLSAVILAYSGSSGNFISEGMALKKPNWKKLLVPIQVRVANGNWLTCTHELPDCKVWING